MSEEITETGETTTPKKRTRRSTPELPPEESTLETHEQEAPQMSQVQPETELPAKLYGKLITPENIAQMLGVDTSVFPIHFAMDNAQSSNHAVPEFGVMLPAYAKDFNVTVLDKGSLEVFCMNCAYLTDLWGWDEHNGILIGRQQRDTGNGITITVDEETGTVIVDGGNPYDPLGIGIDGFR